MIVTVFIILLNIVSVPIIYHIKPYSTVCQRLSLPRSAFTCFLLYNGCLSKHIIPPSTATSVSQWGHSPVLEHDLCI